MKHYFLIKLKIVNRKLIDFGLKPEIGYVIFLVVFLGFSAYLFFKTEYAPYIYALISFSFTSKLSEAKRNDFLRQCFTDKDYYLMRMIENLIIAGPFVIGLIYYQYYMIAVILIVAAMLLSVNNFSTRLNYSIPTPFYKKPFEFTVGFRKAFYIFPAAYVLTAIAIAVNNFNLGVFALLLIFIASISFYNEAEYEYYVWSFAMTPRQFILEKIKTAWLHCSIVSMPIVMSLTYFYFNNTVILLVFYLVGCIFLMTIILAKYSVYPDEMNLPEGIIFASSIAFPPLLLFSVPYFYFRATKHLQRYLI